MAIAWSMAPVDVKNAQEGGSKADRGASTGRMKGKEQGTGQDEEGGTGKKEG